MRSILEKFRNFFYTNKKLNFYFLLIYFTFSFFYFDNFFILSEIQFFTKDCEFIFSSIEISNLNKYFFKFFFFVIMLFVFLEKQIFKTFYFSSFFFIYIIKLKLKVIFGFTTNFFFFVIIPKISILYKKKIFIKILLEYCNVNSVAFLNKKFLNFDSFVNFLLSNFDIHINDVNNMDLFHWLVQQYLDNTTDIVVTSPEFFCYNAYVFSLYTFIFMAYYMLLFKEYYPPDDIYTRINYVYLSIFGIFLRFLKPSNPVVDKQLIEDLKNSSAIIKKNSKELDVRFFPENLDYQNFGVLILKKIIEFYHSWF